MSVDSVALDVSAQIEGPIKIDVAASYANGVRLIPFEADKKGYEIAMNLSEVMAFSSEKLPEIKSSQRRWIVNRMLSLMRLKSREYTTITHGTSVIFVQGVNMGGYNLPSSETRHFLESVCTGQTDYAFVDMNEPDHEVHIKRVRPGIYQVTR